MKTLTRLTFLIHGFCYAETDATRLSPAERESRELFLARETRCAARWRERIESFAPDEGLCIVPWNHGPAGPAAEFERLARSILQERCFILDTVGEQPASDLAEFQSSFGRRDAHWNQEELDTALHSLACCRQFEAILQARNLAVDPARVAAEAWGASFEGCVLKYSLNFRRLLKLAKPIEIAFDLTVPDARFLLEVRSAESTFLSDRLRLRLFLFRIDQQAVALFTATSDSPADPPMTVELPLAPDRVTVLSKQGIRLWPKPEEYHLPKAGAGYYEPPQNLVQVKNHRLHVPVTAGLVYRLAKAPAYIFSGPDLSPERMRDWLFNESGQFLPVSFNG